MMNYKPDPNKVHWDLFWRCCLGGILHQEEKTYISGNMLFFSRPYIYIPCICHLNPKLIEWKGKR